MSEHDLRQLVRRLQAQVQELASRMTGDYIFAGQGGAASGIVFVTPHEAGSQPMLRVNTETGIGTPRLLFDKPDGTTEDVLTSGTGLRMSPGETPSGTINGSNTDFTLLAAPDPALGLILALNGALQFQRAAGSTDVGWYSLSGNTITYEVAPVTGDVHRAWYWY